MTPSDFANLLEARPAGRGKWQAHCPAHRDRSPSLSISEGRDGNVLVRCWAGCPTQAVLAALSLTTRDLFSGERKTPRQVVAVGRKREAEALRRCREREIEHKARAKVRRLTAAVNDIGGRLARLVDGAPDEECMTRLFHSASEKLHQAEIELEKVERPVASGPHVKGTAEWVHP